jgi:hypothetical protein
MSGEQQQTGTLGGTGGGRSRTVSSHSHSARTPQPPVLRDVEHLAFGRRGFPRPGVLRPSRRPARPLRQERRQTGLAVQDKTGIPRPSAPCPLCGAGTTYQRGNGYTEVGAGVSASNCFFALRAGEPAREPDCHRQRPLRAPSFSRGRSVRGYFRSKPSGRGDPLVPSLAPRIAAVRPTLAWSPGGPLPMRHHDTHPLSN